MSHLTGLTKILSKQLVCLQRLSHVYVMNIHDRERETGRYIQDLPEILEPDHLSLLQRSLSFLLKGSTASQTNKALAVSAYT